jgi:hypothetical protein
MNGQCGETDMKVDVKFLLLHDGRNEDGIKSFFGDVWELYLKVNAYGGGS